MFEAYEREQRVAWPFAPSRHVFMRRPGTFGRGRIWGISATGRHPLVYVFLSSLAANGQRGR